MKKQILFLAIFSLAVLAGTNNAWGQLSPGSTTLPIPGVIPPTTCATNALPLHPVPGISFTYTMNNGVPVGEEISANWTWWATKDPTFITNVPAPMTRNLASQLTIGSGDLVATSGDYGVDNKGTVLGTNAVSITWSADILAGTSYQGLVPPGTPTFVVGYSEGVNCADNIQVFEINPQPNFTLEVAAIDAAGVTVGWSDDTQEQCVDDVQSAIYNNGTKQIDMDYGTNTIYYEVAAANFVNNFSPHFQILDGLASTQTAVISIYDSYADATTSTGPLFTSAAIAVAGMLTDIPTNIDLTALNAGDVATGVSFFVKVVIENNTEESLTSSPFQLAVDAEDNTTAGVPAGSSIWDMENADCPTLADAADQIDNAIIIITPRPTLEMDGGAMGEPSTVTPEDVIIKTP
jgi:hypothetical protein